MRLTCGASIAARLPPFARKGLPLIALLEVAELGCCAVSAAAAVALEGASEGACLSEEGGAPLGRASPASESREYCRWASPGGEGRESHALTCVGKEHGSRLSFCGWDLREY